jgi:hypothetical protein
MYLIAKFLISVPRLRKHFPVLAIFLLLAIFGDFFGDFWRFFCFWAQFFITKITHLPN